VSFKDKSTADIWNGYDTRKARSRLPSELHTRAAELIDRILAAQDPSDLRVPPGNGLERLTRDRTGQWSVRINKQYRICFRWIDGAAVEIEIIDYH
jgi:proteic killer suppression protein